MKSRFLLPSTLPEIHRSASALPKASLTRRFELRYNASPRFERRRQERRQGQALLLAVLIMLLAALLSAGFLAVVSGNLNQTARIADKTKASEASRAGIVFANEQLSGSTQGDLWRPIDVSPAPDPTNATSGYDFYYSQLDKVQGWGAKRPPLDTESFPNADYPAPISNYAQAAASYRNNTYGKFPDPNQSAGDAPKFLVKVEELTNNPTDPTYDANHAGELKITSIGLSDDDPNVFSTAIAYKNGRKKSPWASALRSVSNWDFKNNLVPQASISDINPDPMAGTTKVTIVDTDVKGVLPAAPFNIVLSHKDATTPTNSLTFGGVVTAIAAVPLSSPAATYYTVTGLVPTGFVANDTMQVAAALGTAQTVDLLNSGKTPTMPIVESEPLLYPTQNQPNGILANGSLWLQGQYQLTSLQKLGSKVQSSGAVFLSNTTTVTGKDAVPASDDVAAGGTLLSSSDAGFPGSFVSSTGVKFDLINDAWNKLGSTKFLGLDYSDPNAQTRVTEPFKPAKIDSATNLARYRSLTRNSAIDSNGNRAGVYIDNRDDVEKVGTVAMTQAQLVNMWTSPTSTTPADFTRNGTALVAGAAGSSLEQKHLRGWIGPDEFLARGALVELSPLPDLLGNAPSIRVTLDARGDSTAAALNNDSGPVLQKAVRDANGNPQPGVYTQILPWPKDGTLFAEGNIRIRGSVDLSSVPVANAANFPSLTVVSMNNIYIEGSVSVDNSKIPDPNDSTKTIPDPNRKKLMLLAKKNVIVNPTRLVLGHVDAQTVATAPVTIVVGPNPSLSVPVADATNFKVGDRILLDTNPAIITAITSSTQVQVASNNATLTPIVIANDAPVRLAQWKDDYTQTAPYFKVDATQEINRRVLLQDAATAYPNLRLDLDHAGSRPAATATADYAINIKTADASGTVTKPSPLVVKVTNKRVDSNGTVAPQNPIITRDEKRLRGTYDMPTPAGADEFPDAPTAAAFTTETLAKTFSLKELETKLNGTSHIESGQNPKGWKYDAAKNNTIAGGGTVQTFPDGTPAFYLTALGLRNDKYSPAAQTPDNGVKDIGGTDELSIPLATSVRLTRNGANQNLVSTYLGKVMGVDQVADYTVPYIGFNPLFGVVDPSNPAAGVEDALTVDLSFYQPDANILNSTLDSRRFASLTATGPEPIVTGDSLTLQQNDDILGLLPADTPTLPSYRLRALKLENTKFPAPAATNALVIQPVALDINAFVYAQEGSWFVIPGDYFRTATNNAAMLGNAVRTEVDNTGKAIGTYIDFNGDGVPDAGEYILAANGTTKVADLNRNGIVDPGEAEAALRFVRYNYTVNFYGAIVENQTPVVADVADPTNVNTPLATGAVQDWMNKWAAYDNDNNNNGIDDDSAAETDPNAKTIPKWKFITYAYDPSLAISSPGANQLRVPVTDDLIYQQ